MSGMDVNEKYRAILHLPAPTSEKHPRIPIADRAAQFSPFAALTGYDAAVKETGRLTEARLELDEDAKAMLDHRLRILLESGYKGEVTFMYFVPDARKEGGSYVRRTGSIGRADTVQRVLHLTDATKIPLDDIYGIDAELFQSVE